MVTVSVGVEPSVAPTGALKFTVTSVGGSQPLTFAAKIPSGTSRSMGIYVNCTKVGVLTSTNTGWSTTSITATMKAGSNTVELKDTEGTSEPDIDYLEVI